MQNDRILVVDDDPSWQELLRESIESVPAPGGGSYDIRVAGTYPEAAALLDRQHFHLAFVDLRLREDARELEGKELVRKIVELDEGTSVAIATAHADVSTAITALKEWQVLDFILKDAWDPGKVADLVRAGLPAARARYRSRYESAIDFLRGDQEILPWIARVLARLAPDPSVARPERRLGDLLNELLAGLYPLLPRLAGPRVALDPDSPIAAGCFWSKALGQPVAMRFGPSEALARESESLGRGPGFARVERAVADEELRAGGVIYAPAVPPFADFARP